MFAKCIAFLAVLSQISASGCSCSQSAVISPFSESNSQSSPVALMSSGNARSPFVGSSGSGVFSRNIVAKGRYPVALRNCGPVPDQQILTTASCVTAPVQEKPIVRLPACVPAPRTVSHSCTCYKTILRPRVHDQYITVPTIQRYLETSHKPVLENIQYEAVPVNCDNSKFPSTSGVHVLEVNSGTSSGDVKLMPFSSGCTCGCQSVQLPQVQTIKVPCVQIVEAVSVPDIQTVQIPKSVSLGCSSQY